MDVGAEDPVSTRTKAISIHWVLAAVLLQIVVTFWTSVTMYLRPLSVAACDVACDYAAIAVAVNGFLVVAGIVTLLTVPILLLVRRCGWWAISPSVFGSMVVIASFLIANDVSLRAMGL